MIAVLLSSVKQQKTASIHYSNDLVPMSHNQSEYIQHLEAEVKLCKVYSHANVGGLLFRSSAFTFLYFSVCLMSGRAPIDETVDQCGGGGK